MQLFLLLPPPPMCTVYIMQVDIMEISLFNLNKPRRKKLFRDLFKNKWIKLKLYGRQLRCL